MNNPDKCDLVSPFELHGNWWRGDKDQEHRVSGCLSYTPDHGLQLQLYDDLPGQGLDWLRGKDFDRPIWGKVEGVAGKQFAVSLFGPIQTNRPNDPNADDKPSSHTIYFINRAIIGVHALDPDSVIVKSIHFSVSDFESFVNTKPVVALPHGKAVQVSYIPKMPLEITLQEPNVLATISTLVESSSSLFDRNCTVRYWDSMAVTPPKPIRFGDATDMVFSLQNFFLMCVRESVELRYIKGVLESGEIISAFGSMRGRRKRRITPNDWVLTLKEIGTSFQEVLNKWFVLVKKLRFVGPVFFSELASPSPLQDARFFHFAGCLEAFHREVVQDEMGKFVPKKDYREIKKSLLEHVPPTLPEALKEAMRSALSHANDHSFAERIDVLFNALEADTQKVLADDPKRFLAAIKHSRNKLAHVVDAPAGEVFEGNEFAHANLSLQGWLTILILKECGIAESVIRERMTAMQYFYWGPFEFESPASVGVAPGSTPS